MNCVNFKKVFTSLGLIVLWLGSALSQAGTVTLVGDRVNYEYDDSQAALMALGTPQIVGDTVVFLPALHRASSLNGAGIVSDVADFVFSSVYATDGWLLSSVAAIQEGDYWTGNGASVESVLELLVADSDSAASGSENVEFTDTGDSPVGQLYDLSVAANITAMLGLTDSIELTVGNALAADSSANGEYGTIQSKLLFVAALTTGGFTPPAEGETPAPGVLLLMGLGLIAQGVARRRRKDS